MIDYASASYRPQKAMMLKVASAARRPLVTKDGAPTQFRSTFGVTYSPYEDEVIKTQNQFAQAVVADRLHMVPAAFASFSRREDTTERLAYLEDVKLIQSV